MYAYFKGAGILFWKQEKNKIYVHLGKRNVKPYKGYWSVPGGTMDDKDKDDFLTCAVRETNEEYFSYKKVVKRNNLSGKNFYVQETPLIMKYVTYFVKVKSLRPKPNFEFSKVDWFDANLLPIDIHPGAELAVNNLVKRLKKMNPSLS